MSLIHLSGSPFWLYHLPLNFAQPAKVFKRLGKLDKFIERFSSEEVLSTWKSLDKITISLNGRALIIPKRTSQQSENWAQVVRQLDDSTSKAERCYRQALVGARESLMQVPDADASDKNGLLTKAKESLEPAAACARETPETGKRFDAMLGLVDDSVRIIATLKEEAMRAYEEEKKESK